MAKIQSNDRFGIKECIRILGSFYKSSITPVRFITPKEILNSPRVFSITPKVLTPTPSLLTVILLPAVGLTLPCCRPHSREQNAVQPVR